MAVINDIGEIPPHSVGTRLSHLVIIIPSCNYRAVLLGIPDLIRYAE